MNELNSYPVYTSITWMGDVYSSYEKVCKLSKPGFMSITSEW